MNRDKDIADTLAIVAFEIISLCDVGESDDHRVQVAFRTLLRWHDELNRCVNRLAPAELIPAPAQAAEESDDWKALAWQKVSEAHERSRAKTIEECATLCESVGNDEYTNVHRVLASRIRALAAQPPAVPVETSGVVQAAEKAAQVVEGWSDSKREYAERVMGGGRPQCSAATELLMDAGSIFTYLRERMADETSDSLAIACRALADHLRVLRDVPQAVRDGYVLVPKEPTEEMWGGLARDIVMWTRFSRPSQAALLKHLRGVGRPAPDWLAAECSDTDHVPPKGSVAVWIYRAMIEAACSLSRPHGGGDAA